MKSVRHVVSSVLVLLAVAGCASTTVTERQPYQGEVVVPLAVTVATANPIGLIVGGAAKVGGEVSGKSTIEGTAKRTAKQIADELRVAFQKQGWI